MNNSNRFPAIWLFSALCFACLNQPNQAEPDDTRGLGPGSAGQGGDGGPRAGAPGATSPGAAEPSDGPTAPSPSDGRAAAEPEPPAEACGNGRLDPGESCDPASDCPTACPEITCTRQRLV